VALAWRDGPNRHVRRYLVSEGYAARAGRAGVRHGDGEGGWGAVGTARRADGLGPLKRERGPGPQGQILRGMATRRTEAAADVQPVGALGQGTGLHVKQAAAAKPGAERGKGLRA